MNRKFINISLVCLLIAMFGCNKQLDTKPTTSIDQNDALKTSDDVKVALVGAYADLGSGIAAGGDFYGGRIFVGADLLGDFNELNWTGTFEEFAQISSKAIPVDNIFVTYAWLEAYKTINDVNNVLSALDVVSSLDKSRVEGEAKFIRGSAYFDLVRLYAKSWNDGDPATNDGVPIVLTPTRALSDSNNVKRNKVTEVYAQVIADLTDAENKLPESNGFYATKGAAAAMLARVYLQKADYANAATEADNAISVSGAGLTDTYADAFPNADVPPPVTNTSEDIFAMQVTSSSGVNDFNTFYSPNSRGDIKIRDEHLALYEAGDDRLNLFYQVSGQTYTGKFDNLYGNVHIIRLAEMYLIRAEANFRMGTAVGATPLADINIIRERVLLPDLETSDLTLAKILHERKLELAFEGFTLHDVKRLKLSVGQLPFSSPKLIYPIPKREIIANTNLTQNEGY